MKVTITKCDFCGNFIGKGEEQKFVTHIEEDGVKKDADMCLSCYEKLTHKLNEGGVK